MGRYDGSTALVTGGGSGIGEATVELLAREGATVVVADRDTAGAERVAASTGAVAVTFDQGDPDAWRALVAAHPFDVAVINAGVGGRFADLDDVSDDDFRTILGINLDGVLYGTRELARTMGPRGGGRISVTASIGGLVAHHMSPIYAASKWGVVGWVRSIAPSLVARNVRINGVCPALVDTPILGPGGGEMMRQMGLKTLTPAEVAAAHDVALSAEVTGELFTVQVGREVVPFTFAPVPGYQG
jgi:NAD(P)-dependent dehydrogenase (short-subunit alcohol dehydrogenase family)